MMNCSLCVIFLIRTRFKIADKPYVTINRTTKHKTTAQKMNSKWWLKLSLAVTTPKNMKIITSDKDAKVLIPYFTVIILFFEIFWKVYLFWAIPTPIRARIPDQWIHSAKTKLKYAEIKRIIVIDYQNSKVNPIGYS